MRKLILILLAFLAIVTYIRALDITEPTVITADYSSEFSSDFSADFPAVSGEISVEIAR